MDERSNPPQQNPGIPNEGQNLSSVPSTKNPDGDQVDEKPTDPGLEKQDLISYNITESQNQSPSVPNQDRNSKSVPDPQNPSPGFPIYSVPEPLNQLPGIRNQDQNPKNVLDLQNISPSIPNPDQSSKSVPAPQNPSPDFPIYSVSEPQNQSPGIPNQDQNPKNVIDLQNISPDITNEEQNPKNVHDPQNESPVAVANQGQNTHGVFEPQNETPDGIPNEDQNLKNIPDPQNPSPGIPNQDQNTYSVTEPQSKLSDIPNQDQNTNNESEPQNPAPDIPNQIQNTSVPEPQNQSSAIPDQSQNPDNVPGQQNLSPDIQNQGQNPYNVSSPQNALPDVSNQGTNTSRMPGWSAPQDQSTSTGAARDTQSIKSGGSAGNPAINVELHGKVTKYMVYSAIAAILGMFQFGYNAGAVNQPREFIEAFILLQVPPNERASDAGMMFSVIVGVFAIGGMVGAPIAAFLCHKFGRKEILIGNAAFGIVGSLLMGLCKEANSVEMLIVGRLLNGINCGISSAVCPMYVSEIAPVNLRGAFGAANQLAVAIGVTVGQVLGIDAILGSDDTWPILFGLVGVPAAIQFIMLFFAPKSPRYLLLALGDEERAKNVLSSLRGTPDINEEIHAMYVEDRLEKEAGQFKVLQLCKERHLLRPLIIGIVLHLSHQWGGINVLLNFSSTIFEDATLTADQARLASIGVGLVLIVNVFISIFLMDHFGRRKLELFGLGGMAFFSALMTLGLNIQDFTVNVFTVVFAFFYIASFGIGPSSIPWMLMSEMFTQRARSTAVSIGAMVNWFANFVIGISFVSLRDGFATYVFLPFTFLLIIFIIFVFFFLPETRHKTHEQMHHHFKDGIELPGGFIL